MISAEFELADILPTVLTDQCALTVDDVVPEPAFIAQSLRPGQLPLALESAVFKLAGVAQSVGIDQGAAAADHPVLEFTLVAPAVLVEKDPLAVPAVAFKAFGDKQRRDKQQRQSSETLSSMHAS